MLDRNNKNPQKAVIFGLEGVALNAKERAFFKKHNPLGYILFARNCENPKQIKKLTASLRSLNKNQKILILIDQEGGRVARLKPPHWRKVPPAWIFAELYKKNKKAAEEAVFLNHRLIAEELYSLGINVDCAPLIDLRIDGMHEIVGDRALGSDTMQIAKLGRKACEGLFAGGVLPVIKHIPGHGRAMSDSHLELPHVDVSKAILAKTDFVPFKKLSDMPMAMTAHIKYTKLDDKNCATLSKKIIGIIRKEIGFKGLIMTDDLSMKALSGNFAERTKNSFKAGCDVVLHCNGKMEEMTEIIKETIPLEGEALKRARKSISKLSKPLKFNKKSAITRLDKLLSL